MASAMRSTAAPNETPGRIPKESVTAGLRSEDELQPGGPRKLHFCAQQNRTPGFDSLDSPEVDHIPGLHSDRPRSPARHPDTADEAID